LGVVNQDDVARMAGVSRSTVSRALKNDASIPETTRERIRRVAIELGYRPDPFVAANMHRVRRAEKKRIKALLAYLTPRALTSYFREVPSRRLQYASAQEHARELGFEIDVVPLEQNGLRLSGKRCTDILRARGVQGVLIAPFENPFVRLHLDWSEFAVATIGFSHVHPKFSQAASNHYYNISLILRRLHHLGYRRIGLAIPARADRYAQGAFSSVFCHYRDLQPPEHRIERFVPGGLEDWNERNFRKWYNAAKPDAVICINDEVRSWLAACGVRTPEDIGLVHLSWSKGKGDWSGVYQRNELVGSAAVQLVVDHLMLNERGIPLHPKSVLIDGEWVPGKTVRKQEKG